VFWWSHATFVESIIAGSEYFGTPLTPAEKDQLIAEGVTLPASECAGRARRAEA
jgi:uncharacterized protein (DUF2236 family)